MWLFTVLYMQSRNWVCWQLGVSEISSNFMLSLTRSFRGYNVMLLGVNSNPAHFICTKNQVRSLSLWLMTNMLCNLSCRLSRMKASCSSRTIPFCISCACHMYVIKREGNKQSVASSQSARRQFSTILFVEMQFMQVKLARQKLLCKLEGISNSQQSGPWRWQTLKTLVHRGTCC